MKIFTSLLLALALTSACGDDDDHHEIIPECNVIGEACHETTSAEGQACHSNAHDVWTKDECIAESQRCLDLCEAELAVDGGTLDAPAADLDAAPPDDANPGS